MGDDGDKLGGPRRGPRRIDRNLVLLDSARPHVGPLAPSTARRYAYSQALAMEYAEAYGHGHLYSHGVLVAPWPPDLVIDLLCLRAEEGLAAGTLEHVLFCLSREHRERGFAALSETPSIRAALTSIVRQIGRGKLRAAAITLDLLRTLVESTRRYGMLNPDANGVRTRAIRNVALMLLAWAMGARMSELLALDLEGLDFRDPRGVLVTVRRSKTDQEGRGRVVAVPYCPDADLCAVRALRGWIEWAKIAGGAVWRPVRGHGEGVVCASRLGWNAVYAELGRIVERAGIVGLRITPHGFRAGLVTDAARANIPELRTMGQTGHIHVGSVQEYYREHDLFREHLLLDIWAALEGAGAKRSAR